MSPLETVLAKLPGVKKSGKGWSARCPAHEDRKASLSVSVGEDGCVLVKCHAGCTTEAVLGAVDLKLADLFPANFEPLPKRTSKPSANGKTFPTANAAVAVLERQHGKRSAMWTYHDGAGDPVGLVVRWDKTSGKVIRPVARSADGWRIGAMTEPRPLYRLPELATAKLVVVCEGEKAADVAHSLGFTATTSAGGSQAAAKTDWAPLAGKEVWILSDNDDPGRKYAATVSQILRKLSQPATVKFIDLPNLPEKGDIVDWIDAHGDAAEPSSMKEEIERLAQSAPSLSETVPPAANAPPADEWPAPLASEARHGLAGRFVLAVEPHTEADPVALLVSFLIAVGNAIGKTSYAVADGSRHYANEFAVIVGQSSKARKGTSWSRVLEVISQAQPEWADQRIKSGLSSGEGLIYNVRDPVESREAVRKRGEPTRYETVITDEGESDKRLLLVESEFANVLKQTERNGNTLSTTLRDAWDKNKLSPLTKNSPIVATNPHVSIIGHITREELQRYLTATESANGFANRFLWLLVRRSKLLPFGGQPDTRELDTIARELATVIATNRESRHFEFDTEARSKWGAIYEDLSRDRFGLVGNLTGRAEAHVLRFALIYAVLDQSDGICITHLNAALALWSYCEHSVSCIFGDATGNPLADELLRQLRAAGPKGLTRTELHEATGRNLPANRIGQALGVLRAARLVRPETRETVGRPAEAWVTINRE